jgi:hypothetical protein
MAHVGDKLSMWCAYQHKYQPTNPPLYVKLCIHKWGVLLHTSIDRIQNQKLLEWFSIDRIFM